MCPIAHLPAFTLSLSGDGPFRLSLNNLSLALHLRLDLILYRGQALVEPMLYYVI